MSPQAKEEYFEVPYKRYKYWHAFTDYPTIAYAVCDRLFHVAHKFELKGGSMLKKTEIID